MKKILLFLFVLFSISIFAEQQTYQRVEFPVHTNLTDGMYIICYEATSKVKVFQNFDDNAISINRLNDSIIQCDDSLSWELEVIDNKNFIFTLFNGNEYLFSENINTDGSHTLFLSSDYGLVKIINTGEIWSYTASNNGSYMNHFVYYDITTNKFISHIRGTANPNTKLYRKINNIATSLDEISNINDPKKKIINSQFIIEYDNKKYNIFGIYIN